MMTTNLRAWSLAMALLLGGLTLGALRPQAAFPETATMVTVLMMLAALAAAITAPPRYPDRVQMAAIVAAVAWVLVWGLGVWRAPVPALGRPAIILVAQGALAFVAMAWLARSHAERSRAIATWWIAGLATIMGLHAVYQVLGTAAMPGTFRASEAALMRDASGYEPEMLEGILHALREGRASSWWGSPNVFAGLLAGALPVVACLALRRDRWGWASVGAFGVVVWALMLTGSRGGLLGAMAGLGVFGLVLATSMRRGAGVPGVVAAIVMAGGASLIGSTVLAQEPDAGARWLGTSTIGQRLMYWESAWAIWRENPLMGQGPGAFVVFYPQHRLAAANETLYAHSWLFDWGCQVGLVGLGAFVVWVAASLSRARHIASMPMRAGLLGCVAAILAHGLVEFTLQVAEMYLLLALVLGTMAGIDDPPFDAKGEAARRQASPNMPRDLKLELLSGTRFLLFGLCGGLSYRWQEPATRAESLRDLMPYVDAADVATIIEDAIVAEPDHPSAWETKGLMALQRGDLAGAEAAIEQARRLNPWSARLCESLGRVRVEQGRLGDALALQHQAIARHPVDIEHRLRLVELLLAAGDEDAARLAFDEAVARTRTRNTREAQWRDAVAARVSGS